jgi:hypothetical protein
MALLSRPVYIGLVACFVLICAVTIGLCAPAWRQAHAIVEIERRGGDVKAIGAPSWMKRWATESCKRAFAANVLVGLRPGSLTVDEDVRILRAIHSLKSLELNDTPLTDAGLAQVGQLRSLESLSIAGTLVTDDGLFYLSELSDLRVLYLDNTEISDAGLRQLRRLVKLQVVTMNGTRATDLGRRSLMEALPHLTFRSGGSETTPLTGE